MAVVPFRESDNTQVLPFTGNDRLAQLTVAI